MLKLLEAGSFRRLGGAREITVDVRLVAATNRDLAAEVHAGRFREDLYYRLSVMPLQVPALRDRSREDRLALLTRIVADLAPQMPGCPSACSAEALERLLSAPWPGNVREMRSVVERAMILARGAGEIGVEHLPSDVRRGAGGGGGGGGTATTSLRLLPRWSGFISRRHSGSTTGTARARRRSLAFRARR